MSKILNTQEFLKENVENTNPNQITFGFEKNDPRVNIRFNVVNENTISLEFNCYTEGIVKGFGESGMPLKTQFECVFNVTFLNENNYDITLKESNAYYNSSEKIQIDVTASSCISANLCLGGIDNIKNSVLDNVNKDYEIIFGYLEPECIKAMNKMSRVSLNVYPEKEAVESALNDCVTRFAEYIKETIEENLNK